MRFLVLAIVFGMVSTADASLWSKKKGADAEGNCVPALVAENARLYTEIEVLDAVAAQSGPVKFFRCFSQECSSHFG